MSRQPSGPDALSSELFPTPRALPGAGVEACGNPGLRIHWKSVHHTRWPCFLSEPGLPGASSRSLSPVFSLGTGTYHRILQVTSV